MTSTALISYRKHLTNAFASVQSGDKAGAMLSLREALKACNGSKQHRSALFRAMNYVRVI